MINSRLNQNIFWSPFGAVGPKDSILSQGWYHWDEIGGHCYGPYPTERVAIDMFNKYINSLNNSIVIDYDGRE